MNKVLLVAFVVAVWAAVTVADGEKTLSHPPYSIEVSDNGEIKMAAKAQKTDDDKKEGGDADSDDDDEVTTPASGGTTTTTVETPTEAPSRRKRDAHDMEDNEVELMLKMLQEVDTDGNVIGSTKTNDQSQADFSAVTFTLGDVMEDSSLMYSENADDASAIGAMSLSFEAALGTGGKLVVMVAIAKEAGNITLDGETIPVEKGQMKVNFHVEGWEFCMAGDAPNCVKDEVNEVGTGLRLTFAIKTSAEPEKTTAADGMADTYTVGEENHMFISKKVKLTSSADQDSWEDLASGQPTMTKQDGGVTEISVHLPKFEKSVWYDPSFRLAVPGGDGVSAASTLAASLTFMLFSLLTAALM